MRQNVLEIPQQAPAPRQEVASSVGSSVLDLSEIRITQDTPAGVMERAAQQLAQKEGSWQSQGLCNLADPKLFHPKGTTKKAALPAIKICEWCTVRRECLQDAFRRNDQLAVQGGTSASQRKAILKKLKAEREAKKSETAEEPEA